MTDENTTKEKSLDEEIAETRTEILKEREKILSDKTLPPKERERLLNDLAMLWNINEKKKDFSELLINIKRYSDYITDLQEKSGKQDLFTVKDSGEYFKQEYEHYYNFFVKLFLSEDVKPVMVAAARAYSPVAVAKATEEDIKSLVEIQAEAVLLLYASTRRRALRTRVRTEDKAELRDFALAWAYASLVYNSMGSEEIASDEELFFRHFVSTELYQTDSLFRRTCEFFSRYPKRTEAAKASDRLDQIELDNLAEDYSNRTVQKGFYGTEIKELFSMTMNKTSLKKYEDENIPLAIWYEKKENLTVYTGDISNRVSPTSRRVFLFLRDTHGAMSPEERESCVFSFDRSDLKHFADMRGISERTALEEWNTAGKELTLFGFVSQRWRKRNELSELVSKGANIVDSFDIFDSDPERAYFVLTRAAEKSFFNSQHGGFMPINENCYRYNLQKYPHSMTIILSLENHYNMNEGTNKESLVSIEEMLTWTTIPSEYEVKKNYSRHYKEKIAAPLMRDLEALQTEYGDLQYKIAHKDGTKLTPPEEALADIDSKSFVYDFWKNLYIDFFLPHLSYDDIKSREERRALQKEYIKENARKSYLKKERENPKKKKKKAAGSKPRAEAARAETVSPEDSEYI